MFNQPHFKAYFDKLIKEAHNDQPIPEDLKKVYGALVMSPDMNATSLNTLGTQLKEIYYPELTFNQIRKRIFAALGYRSTGLADAMRVRYTQAHCFEELHYPNLWDHFTEGYEESVFGSDFYGEKKFIVPYLEMLYEPHLLLYQSSEENAALLLGELRGKAIPSFKGRFTEGFYLYLDLALDKTVSVNILREWASVFSEVVDVSYTDALNIAAIAMGYKVWTTALKSAKMDSITNTRYTWKYA